jgi:hypothetical protein
VGWKISVFGYFSFDDATICLVNKNAYNDKTMTKNTHNSLKLQNDRKWPNMTYKIHISISSGSWREFIYTQSLFVTYHKRDDMSSKTGAWLLLSGYCYAIMLMFYCLLITGFLYPGYYYYYYYYCLWGK